MKPITYWIQNEAIETLIEECGEYLQKLAPSVRRDLIACLAYEHNHYEGQFPKTDNAYSLVESLNRHEKDLLIAAIASNLCEQESPWLEGARRMSEIEKAHKEGIPLPIGMPTEAVDA